MRKPKSALNRREALQQLGIIGVGTLAAACGNGNDTLAPTPTPTLPPTALPTAVPSSTPVPPSPVPSATATATAPPSPTVTATPVQISCILTPQQTLGPFFIDVGLARSDIREDRQGVPLRVALQLVDADGCVPIRDAVVNVWHTDAGGVYSGFTGQPGGIDARGETFLRGFQVTDANGRVEFTTIYPGWYPGRTPHIHVRIHLDSTTVLATQVYFTETTTDAVYAQALYNRRGERDTTNATDTIIGDDPDAVLLDIVGENAGYAGSIVLGAAL